MRSIIKIIFNSIDNVIHKLFPAIGFILLSLYIWGRYIRNRLPREIPFDLTLLRFIILVIICGSYIYIIYRLIKPKIPHPIILNFLVYIINIVKTFDEYTKQFKIINKIYKTIFISLANQIDYHNFILWRRIILCINIIPHIILLFILFIDTFYFGKLFYFYKAIWLTLFFFIIPFSLYSFNYVCEVYLLYWEKNSETVWTTYKKDVLPPEKDYWHTDYHDSDDDEGIPPNDMEIPYRIFIPIYLDEIYFEQKNPHFYYTIGPTIQWYNNLFKEYDVYWGTCNEIKNEIIERDLNLIIRLKAIQRTYEILTTMTNIPYIIRNMRIILYMGYLICWAYILYKSLHNFEDVYMLYSINEILKTYLIQSKIPWKVGILVVIISFLNKNKNETK